MIDEAYVLSAWEAATLGIPAVGTVLVLLPTETAKAAMAAFVEESLDESLEETDSNRGLEDYM